MTYPLTSTFAELRPAGGFKVLLADPPWNFENYSNAGETKNPNQHYACMRIDEIEDMPVHLLAADDCALFLWCTWPLMPRWPHLLRSWGFNYAGLAWEWIKFNQQTGKFAFGPGYGTRKNLEPCILATRGSPSLRAEQSFFGQKVEANSHSVRDFIMHWPLDAVLAQRREHSRKPDEQYERIEQLFDGPYVELFSRSKRQGWTSWGNETGKFEAVAA